MLRDHPAWGVGLDQFVSQYPRYIKPDAWQERFTSHPHNLILDFYVRLGLLGLAWLIFTLVPFIMRGWRVAMRRKAEDDLLRFALVIGATGHWLILRYMAWSIRIISCTCSPMASGSRS